MSLLALTLILAVTDAGSACPEPSTFSAAKKKVLGQVVRLEIQSVDQLPEPFALDADVLIAWLHRHSDEYWLSGHEMYHVAWKLPETRCAEDALAPYLEMRAAECSRSQCDDVNGLVFRPYIRQLIEGHAPDAGHVVEYESRQNPDQVLKATFPGSTLYIGYRVFRIHLCAFA